MQVLINEHCADVERIKNYLVKRYGEKAVIDKKSGILRACQVAEGLADMTIVISQRPKGRVFVWDVAPGHAIVESAGGKVETLDGQALLYNAVDFQVPPHITTSPQQTGE